MIPTLRAGGVRSAMCLVHPANIVSQRWLSHLGFDLRATLPEIGTGLLLFRRDDP
jgi:L-amino acid N-acyltransferase YncA